MNNPKKVFNRIVFVTSCYFLNFERFFAVVMKTMMADGDVPLVTSFGGDIEFGGNGKTGKSNSRSVMQFCTKKREFRLLSLFKSDENCFRWFVNL